MNFSNITHAEDLLNLTLDNFVVVKQTLGVQFPPGAVLHKLRLILPYSIILFLAIVGNVLVIVTLVVNKRMRTVTNVFLLNLAISDFLLGVFCMPFTLVGVLMREFIFGEAMCRLIPYLQAASVSVSAWTLVSMSVERYYAICHPLKSRGWQTLSHAYRMIGAIWTGSIMCMLPIAILSELQPLRAIDRFKCRESWPSDTLEKIFNIFLDVVLLVTPLLIMVITYSLITVTLWRTIRPLRIQRDATSRRKRRDQESLATVSSGVQRTRKGNLNIVSNMERSLAQKKRVIKMLFVVVLEFFICWTPIHVINTVSLFNPRGVYGGLGYQGISFFQLLAYTSSCCNPITYCFMNSKFRQSFLSIFGCKNARWHHQFPNSLSGTLRIASVSQRNFEHQRCFQETSIVVKNEDTV